MCKPTSGTRVMIGSCRTALSLFQISVVSPAQALVNGQPGDAQLAQVALEAEDGTGGDCAPAEPPGSTPPFTCIVAIFPPIPEINEKDIFTAEATYVLKQGTVVIVFILLSVLFRGGLVCGK